MRKLLYKTLLKVLTMLVYFKRFLVWVLRFFGKTIKRAAEIFLPVLILPVYRLILRGRKAEADGKVRVFGIWVQPLVIAVLGVGALFLAVFGQTFAYAKSGRLPGQGSLIDALIGPSDDMVIEETTVAAPPTEAPSRLEGVIGVTLPLSGRDEIEELAGITSLGGALSKPQITPGAVPDRRAIIEYQIQSGDTLSRIASKFNVSIATILWENNLSATGILRLGSTLRILPVTGVTHKVKKGDTLTKIANTYKADAERILAFNRLPSDKDLVIGETIVIPGGVRAAAGIAQHGPTAPSRFRAITAPPPSRAAGFAGYIWPTSWRVITQYFSGRHPGIDIDGDYNSPIYAIADGVVEIAGWNRGGYGMMILVDHGNGVKSRYAHESKLFVRAGETVTKGQTIGMVGTTGRSTGTHLHFEILVNGRRVNPFQYVR